MKSRDMLFDFVFFFFKQKTAYEIQYGLVGSEMCIRDSNYSVGAIQPYEYKYYIDFAKKIKGKELKYIIIASDFFGTRTIAVSYTHLTLPTSDLVQISVVAVSLKKKKEQKTEDVQRVDHTGEDRSRLTMRRKRMYMKEQNHG